MIWHLTQSKRAIRWPNSTLNNLPCLVLPCHAQPHTALLPLNFKNCQVNECCVNLTVTYQFMPIQGPAKGCLFILTTATVASVLVTVLSKVDTYLAHSFLNLVNHMSQDFRVSRYVTSVCVFTAYFVC